MRLLFQPAVFLGFCLLTLAGPLPAAEISNLRTHYSSTQLTIEYDLLGNPGENDSGVEVVLNVKGQQRHSHTLSLSGDFGRSVQTGKKRRIIWRHPLDFPEGLDAAFKCIVNALPESQLINEVENPSEGFRDDFFAVNRQTIAETRTRLMWTRNANIALRPMTHAAAEKQVQKLNMERYAGHNDWRMPAREDFEGLVFFGKKGGWGSGFTRFIADYLMTCGFTQVQSGNYWTMTPAAEGQYLVANTWNGLLRPLATANYYYLWPVRNIR